MNFFLILLILIGAIVALLLIAAIFIKKTYTVEREIIINRDTQTVFDYLKFIKNQNDYNVWVMMDPNSKRTYTGTDGTEGFIYSWESDNKKVGHGSQTITKVVPGVTIDSKLHFLKPFEGLANAYTKTENQGANQTKVIWGFNSKMKYPSNIMLVLLGLEKSLGNDLETSLKNLKTALEK